MIYYTTFIFTLLLAHVAHTVPACGDAVSPEDMYDTVYNDTEQIVFDDTIQVTWNSHYDVGETPTTSVTCKSLAVKYPIFKNFPDFPYLGASFDIQKTDGFRCRKCWKLTGKISGKTIYFTAIDGVDSGFSISRHAFIDLSGGSVEPDKLLVHYSETHPGYCSLKSEEKN